MTVSEFYKAVGGDYEDIVKRFCGEERVIRFLGLFLKDTSVEDLRRNMKEENYKDAFRAAHTLKGVAVNLGITKMYNAASEITEALRAEDSEKAKALMPEINEIYDKTVSALNTLLGQN